MKYFFTKALLKDGWCDHVMIDVGPDGLIRHVVQNFSPESHTEAHGDGRQHDEVRKMAGFALPGLNNIHSHAFQRAMAGLAEYSQSGEDNFWSWRDLMYRFAARVSPEDLYHIARQLYLEMLCHGTVSVAEFHYLHHVSAAQQPSLEPEMAAEMSGAILQAAEECGIALCLLPVLYMSSGFGGAPLSEKQRRFGHDSDGFARLLDHLHVQLKDQKDQNLGLALHSLRAVTPQAMDDARAHISALNPRAPIHIHIAEQQKEVADCREWSNKRPVEWLLENQPVDARWCLIHATHINEHECRAMAKSGAVAGLCPTTEANLGDGIFPLKDYLDQGGHIAIGSDSHISTNPVEELRWLDYGQRLIHQRRNMSATADCPHTGERLYRACLNGGARASGFENGVLETGKRADLIILNENMPLLAGTPDQNLLDRFIFAGNENLVSHVMVGGRWVIEQGRHARHEEINLGFMRTAEKLKNSLS